MEDRLSHLSDERKWYWRTRNEFEERLENSGRSYTGMSICYDVPRDVVVKNAKALDLLGGNEVEALLSKGSEADEKRPAHIVIGEVVGSMKEQRGGFLKDDDFKAIDAGLAKFEAGGKFEKDEFLKCLNECERTFRWEQFDHSYPNEPVPGRAAKGQRALVRFAEEVLERDPALREELKMGAAERAEMLSNSGADSNIIKAVATSQDRHPTEAAGVLMAHGLNAGREEEFAPFLARERRQRMADAEMSRPAEVLEGEAKYLDGAIGREFAGHDNRAERNKLLMGVHAVRKVTLEISRGEAPSRDATTYMSKLAEVAGKLPDGHEAQARIADNDMGVFARIESDAKVSEKLAKRNLAAANAGIRGR